MELREAVVLASRHYLVEPFPECWCEMSHKAVLAHMTYNMQNYVCLQPAPTIYRQIEKLAETLMEISNGTTD